MIPLLVIGGLALLVLVLQNSTDLADGCDVNQSPKNLDLGLEFMNKVQQVSAEMNINPDWLMACMDFETGGTFSPSVRNRAGSHCVGLIQFCAGAAGALGASLDQLAGMSAVDQLDMVKLYLQQHGVSRVRSLSDLYMCILWPSAVGKDGNAVLFGEISSPVAYRENRGLDLNGDGAVTKDEAAHGPISRLARQGTYFSVPACVAPANSADAQPCDAHPCDMPCNEFFTGGMQP